MNVYQFKVKTITGEEISLEKYKGKALLIVNTASKCGLTPQYKELEEIYQNYKDQDFEILGFPCNQFLSQEPGSDEEIKSFCDLQYKVSFPLFSKIEVNGKGAHPLYKFLKKEKSGILGSQAIKWNFTKFLIDKNGNVLERFAPKTEPKEMISEIEGALK